MRRPFPDKRETPLPDFRNVDLVFESTPARKNRKIDFTIILESAQPIPRL
jgi:hypothetical protein